MLLFQSVIAIHIVCTTHNLVTLCPVTLLKNQTINVKQVLDQVDANLSALDALHWRETTPSGNLQVIHYWYYCCCTVAADATVTVASCTVVAACCYW
jgi:hypothetical protein